jgi:hypothetical protein
VTINSSGGIATSESLSSATTYALTLINSAVVASSNILVVAYTGSATLATVTNISPSNGNVVINLAFSASYTGTVKINFLVSN